MTRALALIALLLSLNQSAFASPTPGPAAIAQVTRVASPSPTGRALDDSQSSSAVTEPIALAVLGIGLAALLAVSRRWSRPSGNKRHQPPL